MHLDQLKRREFIALFGGAAVSWPLAARAQPTERARLLGVLTNLSQTDSESQTRVAALRDGLRKLGWIGGRNVQIEMRYAAGDRQRARAHAAELLAAKPDVLFASTPLCVGELQRATRTIPIVFAQVEDPVALGFVASVPHPGGNITGFASYNYAIATQWVQLLKQIAPNVTRIAAIYDPANTAAPGYLPVMDTAARAYALDIMSYAVRNDSEIDQAIETFAREPNGGLIPLPSPLMALKRDAIISLATKHRLPNLYVYRYYPTSGGLASYGPDNIDEYRRAAEYIDRILKGEKPADLPVQFPTKYQQVINLKAAKALGLEIPTAPLVRADEVIE